MSPIDPAPRSGVAPLLPLERRTPVASLERRASVAPPEAHAMPTPDNAGRTHVTDLGDYITLGIGLAGVGALGVAAAGGVEAVAAGSAVLAKNIASVAKAYGPQLAEDWKAGAERLKSASGVGRVAAEQTTAALTDYARSAVVGAGISGGAALAQHVAHALASHSVAPHHGAKVSPGECGPRP